MGRLLIGIGILFIVAGAILVILERAQIPVGRLPGDLVWRRGNTTIYFPWVTCLLLSILGTLLLWLLNRR